ncbi:MAG: hypothetical protein NC355_05905 [Blautia sp.]|nr:hypothetical protein [Blautia sp.]
MTVHEFGKENKESILLIHPSVVRWDYFGNAVCIGHCIMDGGITPYQLPWIITRLIAVRDFAMVMLGKWGGVKLLEKVFSADDYPEESIRYAADVSDSVRADSLAVPPFVLCNDSVCICMA